MRESQSFDAFYASTVQSVTSKMRALAGDDPQADHAIREAYARAYQQWFEVSGYRDAEGWVLDAAREAYERRRAQTGPADPAPPRARERGNTWSDIYGARRPAADPAATVTGPIGPGPGGPAMPGPGGAAMAGAGQAEPFQGGAPWGSPFPSAAGQPEPLQPGAPWDSPSPSGSAQPDPVRAATMRAGQPQPGALWAGAGQAGAQGGDAAGAAAPAGPSGPTAGGSLTSMLNRRGSGTLLIAVIAVVALVVASTAIYLAFGRKSPASHRTTSPAAVQAKQQPQMLLAGHVGSRSAVPWSLVGPGWVLAEISTAAPDAAGQPSGPGTVATDLVDPRGGRYVISQWSVTATPTLIAWSGNAKTALYAGPAGYSLLNAQTGQVTSLTLPAGVSVTGFTRPDGLNLVAVQQGPLRYKLQRYSLTGALAGQLSFMPVRPGQPSFATCGIDCGALSSPDGLTAVWGTSGDEMQLVGNRGGIIRRLHVPDSGTPPSCSPLRWWGPGMVLASCEAPGAAGVIRRLWLVPADGGAPTALTLASGGLSGAGFYTSAWRASGGVYVTATSSSQCPQAPSGPGGMDILRLASGGSDTPISVPGATGYHNAVSGSVGGRLILVAQMSCPGTSSLLSFNPATGASHTLVAGPSGQAGVISAVVYGTD